MVPNAAPVGLINETLARTIFVDQSHWSSIGGLSDGSEHVDSEQECPKLLSK